MGFFRAASEEIVKNDSVTIGLLFLAMFLAAIEALIFEHSPWFKPWMLFIPAAIIWFIMVGIHVGDVFFRKRKES